MSLTTTSTTMTTTTMTTTTCCINNDDKNSVVFDAVHIEYKNMAPWYDRFWKTYTNATLQVPLQEATARIVETVSSSEHDDDGDENETAISSKFITLVDVGCGTGTFLKHLYDKYNVPKQPTPSLKLYGFEPSEEMLQRATSKFDNVGENDENGNVTIMLDSFPAEQLPLEDNSVDIVVCTNAFHFFRNKQQSLREIRRILKSSNDSECGTLILTDWCNDYMLVRLYHFMERVRWNWMHRYRDAYPSPLRKEELAQLVEGAGLCIREHVAYRVRVFSVFFWGMQSIVATKRENEKSSF